MGGDDVAGMEIMDGADDLSVLGEEAVSHAIDALGVTGGESLLEQFDAMTPDEDLPLGGALKSHEQIVDTRHLIVHAVDKPLGHSGRGLQGLMRHQIEHGHIARMTDTGEDRQIELRTDGAELVVVEATQISRRSAASNDYNAIKARYFFQCRDDRLGGSFSLHGGSEELCLKAVVAGIQLMLEVLVAGGVGGRDDGDAADEGGER